MISRSRTRCGIEPHTVSGRAVVKVGALYAGGPVTVKTFARLAEAAGFDSVWCGDHVASHVDGLAGLGVLAGATEEIAIGTSVIVASFRPAVVTAKALATVAVVAKGRTIAGLGAGGDLPLEFAATGADLRTRGAFLDEAIEVMQLLWRGTSASFRGRWASFDDLALEPVPDPPPPIWIGGRSPAALRRAARIGSGYLLYLVSPEEVARRARELARLSDELGRGWRGAVAVVTFVMGAADWSAALDGAMASSILPGLTASQIRSRWLLGTEEDIVARARSFSASGVDHLILGCPPGDRRVLDGFLSIGRCVIDELSRFPG